MQGRESGSLLGVSDVGTQDKAPVWQGQGLAPGITAALPHTALPYGLFCSTACHYFCT